MSRPEITNMTAGMSDDCSVPGCTGVSGGVCAIFPESHTHWCCAPHAPTCWGPSQGSCSNGTLDSTQVHCAMAGVPNWCCNSTLESCGALASTPQGCVPHAFPNPALAGPLWGLEAPKPTPTPTPKPKPTSHQLVSPVGGVAFSLICAFIVGVVVASVYCLCKRSGWKRKLAQRQLEGVPIEMSGATGVRKSHEMQRASVHELETGTLGMGGESEETLGGQDSRLGVI